MSREYVSALSELLSISASARVLFVFYPRSAFTSKSQSMDNIIQRAVKNNWRNTLLKAELLDTAVKDGDEPGTHTVFVTCFPTYASSWSHLPRTSFPVCPADIASLAVSLAVSRTYLGLYLIVYDPPSHERDVFCKLA